MTAIFQDILTEAIDWLFPMECCLCDQNSDTSEPICTACKLLLPWHENACYRCGLSIDFYHHSTYCESCETKPKYFDRLCALFTYNPPINHLITGIKFGHQLVYAQLLGNLFSENIFKDWYKNKALPEAVIPVPLHYSRLRKRGYNQALEILKPIQKDHSFKILNNVCERIRFTRAQSYLPKEMRRNNLIHAFRMKKRIPYNHVAIMDDVVTTTSTVNAIAYALKNNNPNIEKVDVWCICRA